MAYEVWGQRPWSSDYNDDDVLNYILPPRIADEPVEYYWRSDIPQWLNINYQGEEVLELARKINSVIDVDVRPQDWANKQMGYTAGYFSFNSQGGRCDVCQGEGTVTVPMQFMADVQLTCEACGGKRFKSEILEVKYRDKDVYDVLEMTVNQAIEFFSQDNASPAQLIVKRLKPLQDVGLGYIKLGQSSSTLSGGESQRVKLASFLTSDAQGSKIYVFDEPTTGLHFSDIQVLMQAFHRLIEKGHTVIIVEHNTDVIRQADHIIDLGPEGGKQGGYLVYAGTPEGLKNCATSYTANYI